MKQTTNLKLNKPDTTDFYDISDFNENADIIDEEINKVKTTYASTTQAGIIKLGKDGSGVNKSGLIVGSDGTCNIYCDTNYGTERAGGRVAVSAATEAEITAQTQARKPIVPLTLSHAVQTIGGKLSDLVTTVKTSYVAAINEANNKANIKKNPSATDGDIINTHLTVGYRTGVVGEQSFVAGGGDGTFSNMPNEASGDSSAVIGGNSNTASVSNSAVVGGTVNTASGDSSAVIGGNGDTASGSNSAVFGGFANTASGVQSAVVGGEGNTASGSNSAVIGGNHVKTENEAEVAIGKYNNPSDTTLFTIGNGTSDDNRSNAFSVDNSGNGVFTNSLTSGYRSGTVGERSFVSGGGDNTGGSIPNEASGFASAAVGGDCNSASGGCSAVLGGTENTARDYCSAVVGGELNTAEEYCSAVVGGTGNTALAYQVKIGKYANYGTGGLETGTTGDAFIIGNGTSSAKSNCFRVSYDGYVYGGKTFAANSADNAHFYEWQDGNPNNEDRRGLFVTLDGAKIRIATPEDTYIKGVVSAQPSFVSNAYSDNWQGMYLKDIFGAYLTDENGNYIINPDYDPEQEYIPRENRPEWDWVTNDGDIVLVDDGTCEVNGFATVGAGGKATKSDTKTDYRVMERKDDTHIYVSVR